MNEKIPVDQIQDELDQILGAIQSIKQMRYSRFGGRLDASNGTIRYSTQQTYEDQK